MAVRAGDKGMGRHVKIGGDASDDDNDADHRCGSARDIEEGLRTLHDDPGYERLVSLSSCRTSSLVYAAMTIPWAVWCAYQYGACLL